MLTLSVTHKPNFLGGTVVTEIRNEHEKVMSVWVEAPRERQKTTVFL